MMNFVSLTSNPLFWVALVWSLIWKGFALWRAARQEEKIWFVVILIANTFGLLDILYLAIFSKRDSKAASPEG